MTQQEESAQTPEGGGDAGGVRGRRPAGARGLTQRLRLEGGGGAALASTFTIDGRHLDLVGGLRLQASDGERGGICPAEESREAENEEEEEQRLRGRAEHAELLPERRWPHLPPP